MSLTSLSDVAEFDIGTAGCRTIAVLRYSLDNHKRFGTMTLIEVASADPICARSAVSAAAKLRGYTSALCGVTPKINETGMIPAAGVDDLGETGNESNAHNEKESKTEVKKSRLGHWLPPRDNTSSRSWRYRDDTFKNWPHFITIHFLSQ